MSDICKVKPKRVIVYENGKPLEYVLQCGVRHREGVEVHCSKFKNRECEYMLADMILNDLEEVD